VESCDEVEDVSPDETDSSADLGGKYLLLPQKLLLYDRYIAVVIEVSIIAYLFYCNTYKMRETFGMCKHY
jgi:hypothetical protein